MFLPDECLASHAIAVESVCRKSLRTIVAQLDENRSTPDSVDMATNEKEGGKLQAEAKYKMTPSKSTIGKELNYPYV